MAWWLAPLEILKNGQKSGKYRLVARSDESGGIHGLCTHEHDTIEDASNCSQAREKSKEYGFQL